MPLIHSTSEEAKSKNIATEVKAGKPQKQAVAIGYSIQREAAKKKKKKNARGETRKDSKFDQPIKANETCASTMQKK